MKVVNKKILLDFGRKHSDAAKSLSTWERIATSSVWQNPAEVTDRLNSADHVGRWTVFNISHNKYRLITRIDYKRREILVREVQTHAEYDRTNWERR